MNVTYLGIFLPRPSLSPEKSRFKIFIQYYHNPPDFLVASSGFVQLLRKEIEHTLLVYETVKNTKETQYNSSIA